LKHKAYTAETLGITPTTANGTTPQAAAPFHRQWHLPTGCGTFTTGGGTFPQVAAPFPQVAAPLSSKENNKNKGDAAFSKLHQQKKIG